MLEKPKRRNVLKEHECETCRLHCTFMLTRGILIFILFSLGAPTPSSHFPLHSLAPFSEHPLRYGVLESPLQSWQPRSTIPGYPHPHSSGISTVALPPVHSGYLPVRGMLEPPQQRLQPQNTMPCDLNLEGSAVKKFFVHLDKQDKSTFRIPFGDMCLLGCIRMQIFCKE